MVGPPTTVSQVADQLAQDLAIDDIDSGEADSDFADSGSENEADGDDDDDMPMQGGFYLHINASPTAGHAPDDNTLHNIARAVNSIMLRARCIDPRRAREFPAQVNPDTEVAWTLGELRSLYGRIGDPNTPMSDRYFELWKCPASFSVNEDLLQPLDAMQADGDNDFEWQRYRLVMVRIVDCDEDEILCHPPIPMVLEVEAEDANNGESGDEEEVVANEAPNEAATDES